MKVRQHRHSNWGTEDPDTISPTVRPGGEYLRTGSHMPNPREGDRVGA